jgi:hypothetical protein
VEGVALTQNRQSKGEMTALGVTWYSQAADIIAGPGACPSAYENPRIALCPKAGFQGEPSAGSTDAGDRELW